jgi:predicted unusual protein kinase regulating ubiquinone biosynthesis (AarF/ABC1/UbiB family)
MTEQITISKTLFNKNSYEKVIDTSFSQLIQPAINLAADQPISIQQFFTYYQQLFFTIPKLGEVNSHEYLVKTSTEYIGETTTENDELIQSFLEEINQLRQENLELQQDILNLNSQQNILNSGLQQSISNLINI